MATSELDVDLGPDPESLEAQLARTQHWLDTFMSHAAKGLAVILNRGDINGELREHVDKIAADVQALREELKASAAALRGPAR
jgi:hypothetical protein